MSEPTFEARIPKYFDWLRGQLTTERRNIAGNRAYIANKTFFEQTRIAPLKASARLIKDLADALNVRMSADVLDTFDYIMKL